MEIDKWCTKASKQVNISIGDGVMDDQEKEYVKRMSLQIAKHNLEFRKYPKQTRQYGRLVEDLKDQAKAIRRACDWKSWKDTGIIGEKWMALGSQGYWYHHATYRPMQSGVHVHKAGQYVFQSVNGLVRHGHDFQFWKKLRVLQ